MVRVGVMDGIELGVGLARADIKVRLFHVGILSAAIDPIGRIVVTQDGYGEVAELPVLVGVRDLAAPEGSPSGPCSKLVRRMLCRSAITNHCVSAA